jgi:hypothetical protein
MSRAVKSENVVFHVTLALLIVMCVLSVCFLIYGGWNNVTVMVGGPILGAGLGVIWGMLVRCRRSRMVDKHSSAANTLPYR